MDRIWRNQNWVFGRKPQTIHLSHRSIDTSTILLYFKFGITSDPIADIHSNVKKKKLNVSVY